LLLDDSNHALLSQARQGGILGSINDASIQPYQGPKGFQEPTCGNQYVYQPLAPSGGAYSTSGANNLHGTPAVPATMAMAASTGNRDPFKRHFHLGFQAADAHPTLGGPVQLGRSPENGTDVGGTADSSISFCPLSDPWATAFDVSVSRPTAQAVASQMNIVTPYTSYGHDGEGTSAGAAVCVAASSAPGPTRNFMGACGTALSDRSDAVRCRRNPPMCVGYDQSHLRVPTRRATRPSRSRATRGPVVQFEADANALATRLLNEGADSTAVELLSTQVFNNGVSVKALTVKSICREQSTSSSSTRSKYRLLLADVERKDGSKGYCCLLCPAGRRKEYKNPQDSIRHLCKAHFGIASYCGWYVAILGSNHSRRGTKAAPSGRLFYRTSEMNQHQKKYCQMNIDRLGAPARPSVSNI